MQLLFSSLPFRGSLERNVGKERERERVDMHDQA